MARPKKEITAVHPMLAHLFAVQDEKKISNKMLAETTQVTANKISRGRRGLTELTLSETMRLAAGLGWSLQLLDMPHEYGFPQEVAQNFDPLDGVKVSESGDGDGFITKLSDPGYSDPLWDKAVEIGETDAAPLEVDPPNWASHTWNNTESSD